MEKVENVKNKMKKITWKVKYSSNFSIFTPAGPQNDWGPSAARGGPSARGWQITAKRSKVTKHAKIYEFTSETTIFADIT